MIRIFLLLLFHHQVLSCGDILVDPSSLLTASLGSIKVPTVRIIGGTVAEFGKWPWQAYIKYRDYTDGAWYICGGTVISNRHILTAAHCTITMEANSTFVLLGSVDSNSTAAIKFKVQSKTTHPNYSANEELNPSQLNDIAILTLEQNIPFSVSIQPICLPSADSIVNASYAVVTGFGAFNTGERVGNKPSPYLQQTIVPIVETSLCSKKWMELIDYGGGFEIDKSQVCAGAAGHGTAQGDSGGPLVIHGDDGKWYQMGITSFGINFGKGYYDQGLAPGIYTRVTYFCDFIKEVTSGEAICGNSVPSRFFVVFPLAMVIFLIFDL